MEKKLRKYYYIETEEVEDGKPSFTAWYARFVTIPVFGVRFTLIYGLDFMIFEDFKDAQSCLELQKHLFKYSVERKYKR